MSPTQFALVKALILPPGIFLVVFVACFCIYNVNRKVFICLLTISVLFLYLFSTPAFSRFLSSKIENYSVIDLDTLDRSKSLAIVVLGCNRQSKAPEYSGRDIVSACTLVRLRYAAVLQSKLDIPIIVSGGSVFNEPITEASLMKDVLINEFNTTEIIMEDKSRNTIENANEVTKLLDKDGIEQAILVTHASHMMRAEYSFEKNGLDIIPAPTYFYSTKDNKPFVFDFLPTIKAFYISNITLYEMLGYIWIRL